MDLTKTNRDIKALQAWFQPYVLQLLALTKFGEWEAFITEGYRSNERQNYLYSSGRTRVGKILTYARAGQSDHNYGRAVDLCFKNRKGQITYALNLFQKTAIIAKKLGFLWGGDWKSRDNPHFYMNREPKL